MPVEVRDREEFIKLAEAASECVVKRVGNTVKLKLRAAKLYTLKVSPDEADAIIKQLRCPVTDIEKSSRK